MTFNWDGLKYATISELQAEMGNILIDTIPIKPDYKILDIGCGVGNITTKLASICNRGFVVGIDSSSSMINQAKTLAKFTSNIEFRVLEAGEIQFEKQFDVIFSNSTLHWILENKQVLLAMHKALKPNGYIRLQFPLLNDSHPLINYTSQVIKSLKLEEFYKDWKFPWYVTTDKKYKILLQSLGYQNVEVKKVQNTFKFTTASEVYNFFDSVGLALYLEPLNEKQQQDFKEKLLQKIEQAKTTTGIFLKFERLFAFGNISK